MGVNYDPEKRGIDDPLVEAYGHAVYGENYGADFVLELKRETPANKFTMLTGRAQTKGYHLYLMLDEYDNFTNTMLRAEANGEARGKAEGKRETMFATAKRMIESGMLAVKDIAKFSGLSLAQVKKLQAEMA